MIFAAAIAALIAVLVIGLLLARPWERPGQTAGPTVWQGITAGIREGEVPLETALQAFAYVFNVDIPGVQVPAGASSNDAPTSGTGAFRWVKAHWAELTPGQRDVVDRVSQSRTGDLVIPVTGPDGEQLGAADRIAAIGYRLPGGPIPGRVTSNAPAATVGEAVRDDLFATITHIGQKLGLPVIREGLFLKDVTLTLTEESGLRKDGSYTFWWTQPVIESGHYSPCNLTLYKNMWSKETPGQPLSATMHVTLTHEVIHCYQYQVINDVVIADLMPPWIMEGTAIWLAGNDTGIVEPMSASMWTNAIMGRPWTSLTARTYDAYGWYALLDHLGRPMWSLIADAWRAAATSAGAGRSEAFIAVLNGDADDVRRAWAPPHAREPSWNDPWIPYGLGLPPDVRAPRISVVASGAGYTASLPDRSNAVYTVTESAGEIVIVETDGLASAHDGAVHSALAFSSQRFCVEGDCICPPRTRRAGEHIADADMLLPFVVAFQAPAGGAGQRISSTTLEQECGREKPTPTPTSTPRPSGKPRGGANPCANGCAGSVGDPHLETIDLQEYDFQAAGEYVLLRSPDGSTEIQARQVPYPDIADVSINTALAWKVNGHRIGMYAGENTYVLHVDGAEVDPRTAGTIDLGGGAAVTSLGSGIEVAFPDGTISTAVFHGNGFADALDIQIAPSDPFRALGVGLLGPIIPGSELPAMPDGSKLQRSADRPTRYAQRYAQLGPAWHVTDQTSLFDYAAAESSSTFDRPGFPSPDVAFDIDELQARAGLPAFQAAAEACAPVQANERERLHCVFDVMATKDPAYVDFYRIVEQFLIDGPTALDGGPTPSQEPTATPTTTLPAGFFNVEPNASVLRGAAIGPDGNVYLSVQTADQAFELLELDPANGTILKSVPTNGGLEVAVAGGSVWLGTNGPTDGTCAIVRFEPGTLVEQATLPVGCSIAPRITATDDAMWWVDISTADANGHGGRLRRIDPATNEIGPGVELPAIYDFILSSHTTVFAGGDLADPNTYRLSSGDATFVSLGSVPALAFPADGGLWTQVIANGQAQPEAAFYSGAGGPQQRLAIDGRLVGADDQAVYAARFGQDGRDELWRYAADGSTTTLVAPSATLQTTSGQMALSYGGTGGRFLVGEGWAVASWMVYGLTTPNVPALVVQAAPLP
jgi:hypothetical protein